MNGAQPVGRRHPGDRHLPARPSRGLYNLYVVDPSEQQIRAYPPASDGGGFPAKSSAWLATARAVDKMTSMYIDGDIYITENGVLDRYTSGKSDAWEAGTPGDELLRPTSSEVLVTGSGGRNEGRVYTFDRSNDRVLAYDKRDRRLRRAVPAGGGRRLDGPARDVRHRRASRSSPTR